MSQKRTLAAALILLAAAPLFAADWPQWRGPNRDGAVPAFQAPAAWPKELKLEWKAAAGEGYSAPVASGTRLFLHERDGDNEVVRALDIANGRVLWTDRYPAPFSKNPYARDMAKGPFSTPLAVGNRVFTLGGTAVLSAYDQATGKLLWRKDESKNIDTSKLFTGTAMSPLYEAGRVVVHLGDDRGGIVTAFDPATGKVAWEWKGDGPGYASPVAVTLAGTRQIVTLTDKSVISLDAATGTLLWKAPFPDEWNENIVTPIPLGDLIMVSGVRAGTKALKPMRKAAAWEVETVWQTKDVNFYMSSPILDSGVLYGLSARNKGQYVCLDAKSGKLLWATQGRSGNHAALINAGPNVLIWTTQGEIIVLKKNTAQYEEAARYTLAQSSSYAHPAIAGSRIVIRDANSIAVYSF
ncbi:MAG: PQQ-binding-like beta-propeller repeat protein [Bryobacteraceae bacterium]|nr:PQQ-binding-like beta-propeller repeat protein [Bryobacteraceae bacterium]